VCAGEDQRIHGASHADVAETALFFELVGVVESARMREETLLKAGEENERNSRPLAAWRVMRVTRASGSN